MSDARELTPAKAATGKGPLAFQVPILIALAVVIFSAAGFPGSSLYFATDDWKFLERILGQNLWQALDPFLPGRIFYRPLTQDLYFRIMYSRFGLHPRPYHLVNLFIFGVNLYLVYRVSLRFLRQRSVAAWAVFLYAAASVNSRLYTWVSAIQDLLMISFALLAVLCFLAASPASEAGAIADGRKKLLFPVLGPCFFLFSLLAKESALWLPIWFWIYDLGKAGGRRDKLIAALKSRMRFHLPFDLVFLAFLLFRIIALPPPRAGTYAVSWFGPHLFVNFIYYLNQSAYALGLPVVGRGPKGVLYPGLALAAVAGFIAWTIWKKRLAAPVVLGLAWLFLGIMMFLPLQKQSYEYYISLAVVGLFLIAGAGMDLVLRRLPPVWSGIVFLSVLGLVATVSVQRTRYYFVHHWVPASARGYQVFHRELLAAHPTLPPGARIVVTGDLRGLEDASLFGLRMLYHRPELQVYLDEQVFQVEQSQDAFTFSPRPGFDYRNVMIFSFTAKNGFREFAISPDGSEIAPVPGRKKP